ncbi:MAG: murein biosynthesis integral membrane protein MurJ [Bdellovibrionaceae bacterium]|nr:murein biosynthesis integral membrane protein MurJ [Pseudobdellovibrionaceae bacterium]
MSSDRRPLSDSALPAGPASESGAAQSDAIQSEETQQRSERNAVTVSAIIFAAGTLLSRVLGLIRDMMTARYFSVEIRDAFLVAFRLPNLFRRLLGEGSLSVSFIPVFVELLQGKRQEESHRLVNNVFAILMTVSMTVSFLGILFMDDLLRVVLSGNEYTRIAGKLELTVHLARVMFSFLILMSLFAFFMAILNSLRQFALSALAPALLNVALIAAALVSEHWAAPEMVLAWAVMLGGFLQMAILVPSVVKAGYFPRPSFRWNTPETKRVIRVVLPSMFGMSIMQVTQMVNLHFASHLPQGTHSAFYLADRVLELPLSIFVVSVGSALLPTLARFWASQDRNAMSDTINHYIRLILFVALPAAVGMFVLATPITEVLFQGRQFTAHDTAMTAQILQVYAFGLIVSAGVRILAQGFYAIQNTWFPACAATVAVMAHLLFAANFTEAFGIRGLASATVASATVNLALLVLAYNAWVGSLHPKRLAQGLVKFCIGAAVMIGVLQMYGPLTIWFGASQWGRAVALAITITSGGVAYMLVAHILRVPEYQETVQTFGGKLKSKFGRLIKR